MRPRPTTPTVFSSSSTPVYLLRFHSPFFSASLAGAMLRARGEQQADGELGGGDDVGGRGVDDHDAGLGGGGDVDVVEADAGAGDDLEVLGGGDGLGVDLGRGADEDRVDVGERGQQLGAVGAVAVADLEVGAERVDGGGRELFGDEYDGLGSREVPPSVLRSVIPTAGCRCPGGQPRTSAVPGAYGTPLGRSRMTGVPACGRPLAHDVTGRRITCRAGRQGRTRARPRSRCGHRAVADGRRPALDDACAARDVSARRSPRRSPGRGRRRPSSSACAARGRWPRSGAAAPFSRSALNSGAPASWSSMNRWANAPFWMSARTAFMSSLTCAVDDARAGDVVAVLGGVGDRPALLGDAALVHEVDDELELVQALEVGDLGLVAGLDQRLEAGLDQLRGTAAEHRLLAEQVGLGLLGEGGLDAAGAQAADRLARRTARAPRPARRRPARRRRARARRGRRRTRGAPGGRGPWGRPCSRRRRPGA